MSGTKTWSFQDLKQEQNTTQDNNIEPLLYLILYVSRLYEQLLQIRRIYRPVLASPIGRLRSLKFCFFGQSFSIQPFVNLKLQLITTAASDYRSLKPYQGFHSTQDA
jgi:hypothetical protein